MATTQKVSFHSFTMSVRTEMRARTVPSVGWSPAIGPTPFLLPPADGEAAVFLGDSASAASSSPRLVNASAFLAVVRGVLCEERSA